jgi:hypothetical protein
MDVAQHVGQEGEAWSTAVRLRPDWKRRLSIILCVMAAVCVASAGWVVLGSGVSAVPSSPDAIPIVVVGALDPYADNGAIPARQIMTGPEVDEMVNRLKLIRQHLMLVHTYYQMQAEPAVVHIAGNSATVTAQLYDEVQAPGNNGDMYQSAAYPWTFMAVHQLFPQPGWFMTDFTAPDECQAYVKCTPTPPAPSPSVAAYPPIFLSCAHADAQGVIDTVVPYTITVEADGVADFSQAWQSTNVSCTTDPLHDQPVVSSPVERAAIAAAGTGSGAVSIGTLYADCAARFDLDRVAGARRGLGERVGEFRGVLVLCPGHPDAKAIHAAIDHG